MPRVIGFFGQTYVLKSLPRVAAACLLYGVVRVKVGRYILSSEFGLILRSDQIVWLLVVMVTIELLKDIMSENTPYKISCFE